MKSFVRYAAVGWQSWSNHMGSESETAAPHANTTT